jgi:hypothetical protein
MEPGLMRTDGERSSLTPNSNLSGSGSSAFCLVTQDNKPLSSGFHAGGWLAGVGDVESAPDLGECGLLTSTDP